MSFFRPFSVGPDQLYVPLLSEKLAIFITTAIVLFLMFHTLKSEKKSNLPLVNPRKPFEFSNQRRLNEFRDNCKQLLAQGRAMYPGKPFRMFCPEGEVVVWPTKLINEVRSESGLNFVGISKEDSHSHIPGFEPFSLASASSIVVNKYLNKTLAKLTQPVSQETTLALAEILPDCPDWVEVAPRQYILPIIARVSSRVFLGEEMCRNKEWIQASSGYAPIAFQTSGELREWPITLRPFIHWFLPSCQRVRAQLTEAKRILRPYVNQRNTLNAITKAAGEPLHVFNDSIEWFQNACGDACDPTIGQVSLSMAAIHTTSDLLQETMIQIARHPEFFQSLRREVIEVLSTHGLKKTALYELKLMDSVIKESQRMKPILLSTMRRIATKDIQLSSGFVIRKGDKLIVDSTTMWDSAYHENADKFDGYRFLKMRQESGKANAAQLASTSPDQMGFGHGLHSCPGRFFASNEVKVVLSHLLLKYDWKILDGYIPQNVCAGWAVIGDPATKFLIKRRQEELNLESLDF